MKVIYRVEPQRIFQQSKTNINLIYGENIYRLEKVIKIQKVYESVKIEFQGMLLTTSITRRINIDRDECLGVSYNDDCYPYLPYPYQLPSEVR